MFRLTGTRSTCFLFLGMLLGFPTNPALSQTSSNLTVIAQYPDPQSTDQSRGIWGYTGTDNKEYALLTVATPGATVVYEIFDGEKALTTPKQRGRIPAGFNSNWQEVTSCGTYAYKVSQDGSHGLQIIDLAPLNRGQNAVKVSDITTHFRVAHTIYCDEVPNPDRLYVAYGNTAGVMIFSLENPRNPALLATLAGSAHDMHARGNSLYISKGGSSQVHLYDVTDPASPQRRGTITLSGYAHSAWLTEDGKTLLTTEETEGRPLGIFNISNPASPVKLLDFRSPGTGKIIIHNIYVNGNYAYIANNSAGLRILDISNISAPKEIAFHRPSTATAVFSGSWGAYCWFKSGLVIHGDRERGLMVVKPTNVPTSTEAIRISPRLSVHGTRNGVIDFHLPQHGQFALSLYTPHGKEVFNQWSRGSAGMQSLVLDKGRLSQGTYLVKLRQDERHYHGFLEVGD